MRFWPKTEAAIPTLSVEISSAELARMLALPDGMVIRDVWTTDYAEKVRFIVGTYSDSLPPQ